MVPSSTVFEMYPLGFLTIASYLHDRGMQVRIVNLALRMMNSRRFDVPRFLARQKPKAVGIDLHWLPHAHGALEVARIVKEVAPRRPGHHGGIVLELFSPRIDRLPTGRLRAARRQHRAAPARAAGGARRAARRSIKIPNLTWKDAAGIHVNPLTFVPMSLDYVDLRPDLMVEMVMRYRDLESTLPFNGWWNNPITTVFTVKGCAFECVTCGSVAHDLHAFDEAAEARVPKSRELGRQHAGDFPPDARPNLAGRRSAHGRSLSMQLKYSNGCAQRTCRTRSCSSSSPCRRHRSSGTSTAACATGAWSSARKATTRPYATRRRAKPAIPPQDMESIIGEARAAALLADRYLLHDRFAGADHSVGARHRRVLRHTCSNSGDKRLSCFISPMGPFIDPGSRGFEEPDRFGYRLFARTLEEHRQLLVQPTWEHILNYETKWMTPPRVGRCHLRCGGAVERTEGAARAPLEAARPRRRARHRRGAHAACAARWGYGAGTPGGADAALLGEISRFSISTVCDKRELFWPRRLFNFKLEEIARILGRYFTGRSRARAA